MPFHNNELQNARVPVDVMHVRCYSRLLDKVLEVPSIALERRIPRKDMQIKLKTPIVVPTKVLTIMSL